ncbi:MAG: phosphoadenosine phosphosulfate reductase, partial [Patiriisocius sp.]
MGKMIDIEKHNILLQGKGPDEIVQWALTEAKKPVLTTNFGPYSASILSVISKAKEDLSVLWIDTGYNTPQTYKYASEIINLLSLNVITYVPKQT